MPYAKPFREIEELIEEIQTLGMSVPDVDRAARFFRRIGYYRSGAYRYVFRELLPEDERDARSRTFRKDDYVPGSSIVDVMKLEEFDSRIRGTCLIGLSDFEVRVRAAIAHVLARRNVFAYTMIQHLDPIEVHAVTAAKGKTKFDEWTATYKAAIASSSQEDFVAHLLVKYGHPLPIWAVVDVLSFGNLPYLYDILQRDDRIEVAKLFGVAQERKFAAWLRSMVDFRNYSAHGSRLFNRHFKRDIGIVAGAIDLRLLAHVLGTTFSCSERPHSRLYINAALLAYMLRKHGSGSRWHLNFKTTIRKLPALQGSNTPVVDLERSMGFPPNWDALDLWQE